MSSSLQELLILMLVILVLSGTGWWPRIMRGLRELRGGAVEPEAPPARDLEIVYRMLGVSSSASWDEIERAFRAKAKVHHPDRGGDEDAMRALNEAYSLLKRMHKTR